MKSKNGKTYSYAVAPYSGSASGSYTGKMTVRLTGTTLSSVTNVKGRKLKVKWKKDSKVSGYEVQYASSSKFSGAGKKTVNKKSTVSVTISGLTKNRKYYVRIRSYKKVSGTKYYSAWSDAKSVTIKKIISSV